MVVIKFATESMRGAAMVAANSRSRCEGAEVEQQGPAAQAEFRVKLMAVQAAASVHQTAHSDADDARNPSALGPTDKPRIHTHELATQPSQSLLPWRHAICNINCQFHEDIFPSPLMLEAAHFGEELVGQDADVGPRQTGSGEDINHLSLGNDRLGDELSHRSVELFGRLPIAGDLLAERRLQSLEERDVIADRQRLIARRSECEGTGDFRHDLHEAFLALFLFEDVLLSGRNER